MAKKIRLDKRDVERILVIRLAMIGDVLLTTPFIRGLRENFPKSRITYIAGEKSAPILERNPNISELITSNKKVFARLMKKEKYDLAVDLTGVNATAKLCMLSGARYRLGIYGNPFREYNITIGRPSEKTNVFEYFSSLLKRMGCENHGHEKTEICLTPEEKEFADNRLRNQKRKIVGIQPACNLKGRVWPAEDFAALADMIIGRHDSDVLIFRGPGEERIALKMKNKMRHKAVLLPVLPLRKYLAVLSRCDLFIGNEGGQLHMAMALEVPAIGIFAESPWLDYWFCYRDGLKKAVSKNINDITAEDVMKEIEGAQS